MNKSNSTTGKLLVVDQRPAGIPLYIIDDAAEKAGVSRSIWIRYWRWGLANSNGDLDPEQRHFDEDAIYRVRRAEEIRATMETNLKAAATIVRLLEKIEELERDLHFYR